MQTVAAKAVVNAGPAEVYSAVLGLVRGLWSVTDDDVIDARPGERLIHAVLLDDEISCWLTWDLAAGGPKTTRLRLVHADADLRDAPEPELEAVLDILTQALDEAGGRYSGAHGDGN